MITNARPIPFRSLEDMVLFLTHVAPDGSPRMRFRYVKADLDLSIEFYLVPTDTDAMELFIRKSHHTSHLNTDGDVTFPCIVTDKGDDFHISTSQHLVDDCREFDMRILQEMEFEREYVQINLIPQNNIHTTWSFRWKMA